MTTVNIDNEKVAVKNVLDSYVTSVENADIELYAKTVANDLSMVNLGLVLATALSDGTR